MGLFKRRKRESSKLFFRMLEVMAKHGAKFTYIGGFPNVPGVETPPEQIALTVESDVGERVNLVTMYENDTFTDPGEKFSELRDIVGHDGSHRTRGGVVETSLNHESGGFSDAVSLIGCKTIRKAVMEKASLRTSFSTFFRMQARENPSDASWQDAAQRLDASAYIIIAKILDELDN
jgi:hypothetical protein